MGRYGSKAFAYNTPESVGQDLSKHLKKYLWAVSYTGPFITYAVDRMLDKEEIDHIKDPRYKHLTKEKKHMFPMLTNTYLPVMDSVLKLCLRHYKRSKARTYDIDRIKKPTRNN